MKRDLKPQQSLFFPPLPGKYQHLPSPRAPPSQYLSQAAVIIHDKDVIQQHRQRLFRTEDIRNRHTQGEINLFLSLIHI